MSDSTYSPKTYRRQGGDEFVVAPGGILRMQGFNPKIQPAPTAKTTVTTLTIAELLTKIITAVPTATGATIAYTLPTGTNIDAGASLEVNDSFDWTLINSALAAADTITVTANADHTIVGGPIVQSLHSTTGGITGYSAQFRTRKSSAGVFVTYRIA